MVARRTGVLVQTNLSQRYIKSNGDIWLPPSTSKGSDLYRHVEPVNHVLCPLPSPLMSSTFVGLQPVAKFRLLRRQCRLQAIRRLASASIFEPDSMRCVCARFEAQTCGLLCIGRWDACESICAFHNGVCISTDGLPFQFRLPIDKLHHRRRSYCQTSRRRS